MEEMAQPKGLRRGQFVHGVLQWLEDTSVIDADQLKKMGLIERLR